MAIKNCRVCGNKFFLKPLLSYKNMPRIAQFLPDKKSLKKDKGVYLKVFQCSSCGLVQLNNNPVSYYEEVIRAVAVSSEMKKFRKKQFSDFIEKFSLRNRKIIEVGCGKGEYLEILKQCGAKAYGLEYSRDSVEECRKMGLKVEKGFIEKENYKIKNSPFDAFLILSFLEHLPDPNTVLKGIYNNLKDSGTGIIEVPNFDMILEKNLFSEFMTDHLFYFTEKTLTATLNLNGFEIIKCDKIWHNYIISAVVKKREKLDLSNFYKNQKKIKKEIEKYISRFKDKKVAIWGAGHQALAVIALMNLNLKIKYVIDSALFKQGRFTPVTHIPIFAPEMIEKKPIDAIIIIAGSYSDEVARIIRKKYSKSINIAILRDFGLEGA